MALIKMLDVKVPISASMTVSRECPAYELPILRALFKNEMTGDVVVVDDTRAIEIDTDDPASLLASLSVKYPGDKALAIIQRIYPDEETFADALEKATVTAKKPKAAKKKGAAEDPPEEGGDADPQEP